MLIPVHDIDKGKTHSSREESVYRMERRIPSRDADIEGPYLAEYLRGIYEEQDDHLKRIRYVDMPVALDE